MDSKWKPSVPDPNIFQIPKASSKSIIIKPPNGSNKTSASRGLNENEWPTLSSPKNDTNHEQNLPRTLHSRQDDCEPAAEPHPANSGKSSCLITSADISASNGHTPFSRKPMMTSPQQTRTSSKIWQPDVFVQAFVPQAFLTVNNAPAKSIISKSVEGINFPRYVAAFASPIFLPPPFCPEKMPSISRLPLLAADDLNAYNYERHFIDCVMLDLEAQTPEVRSHDLFGVQLHVVAQIHHIYSLHVPGIRESAPRVAYGDIVMLRQLILDSRTSLPQGIDFWVSSGNRERGLPAPGFTGYEIVATVVAVDMKSEKLHLRAEGVSTSIPLVFNVSFVVQGHQVHCLQHTIADIANELTSPSRQALLGSRGLNPSFSPPLSSSASRRSPVESVRGASFRGSSSPRAEEMVYTSSPDAKSTGWLRRMLFPHARDGKLLNGFPSGNFKQIWYDSDLNYEQMKAVNAIQMRNHGGIPYLINGPPGTGKTKTVVEAVTQLANDLDFIGAILVCAPSDPAADILALRLKCQFEPSKIIRLNEYSRTFAEVPQELLPYCYIEDKVFNLPPLPILMSYRIVVATCRGAEMLHQARLANRDLVALQKNVTSIFQSTSESQKSTPLHWTALFVDEAAQATEPEILIPLAVVAPHESRSCHPDPIFAMAGDQHQLGPRTYDKTTALHISLFERLSRSPTYASHPQSRAKVSHKVSTNRTIHPPFINLIRNYRSHPAILAVPSSIFYNNTLVPEATQTETLASWPGWLGRRWPVLFACNNGIDDCEELRTTGSGWFNRREAHKAICMAGELLRTAVNPTLQQAEICIMSPFRAQVRHLREAARAVGLWDLNIGPMDAFQGLEKRVVILCTTRTRSRFLAEDALRGVGVVNEPKKFNVAITRAKEGLVVLGNPWVLHRDPCWNAFLRFCQRNGLWRNDEEGRDLRMPDGEESLAEAWEPEEKTSGSSSTAIEGLEAALVYRDAEPGEVSDAARRFMSSRTDDEMWTSGVEAMEALGMEIGIGEDV